MVTTYPYTTWGYIIIIIIKINFPGYNVVWNNIFLWPDEAMLQM